MSAKANEVYDSWLGLFPDVKIRLNDLTNPTEAFITSTLIHYLRAFGYKVEPMFQNNANNAENVDNSREKRLFLIKLSKHIQHILQISQKKMTFSYYDLIKPSPKKTLQVLWLLLNYLCYFNMYKKDVNDMAAGPIRNRQELLKEIAQIKHDTEQYKLRSLQLKSDIDKVRKNLSSLKKDIDYLSKKKQMKEQTIKTLRERVETTSRDLAQMLLQKNHWSSLLVSESEGRELKSQLKRLQCGIEEVKSEAANKEANLKERKADIAKQEQLFKLISDALEIIPQNALTEFKELKKQMETLQKEMKSKESVQQEFEQINDQLEQKITSLENALKTHKTKHEEEKKHFLSMIGEKERKISNYKKKILELEEVDHALECDLAEDESITEYLKVNIDEILSFYRHRS